MCNGHDFIAHVIAKLIFSLKGLFDQFEHPPSAYFVTSSAAYAFIDIDRFNKSRGPCLTAPRVSDD
jgi:hypothetical protein